MVYLDLYMRWCESVTVNEQQLQMVLANASVNKYFNFEYAKCITKFIDHMSNYPDANRHLVESVFAGIRVFSTWLATFPPQTPRYFRLKVARLSTLHLEAVQVHP